VIAWIRKHPLAFVLIVALIVRLLAVVYAKGFIHSDDYYDTVEISYDWVRHGLFAADGNLHWREQPATTIVRFPLYTLILYGIMKAHVAVGITSLDSIMYTTRLLHALLSLIPVWVVFRIVRRYSKSDKWAIFGGLFVALHFAMPFMGVRNLIEMVGGNIWILAIYYIYRYDDSRRPTDLYWAGLYTGLAWMIRFQLAFAVVPVPLVLWYVYRSIKPAIHYSLAVAIMLVLSGIADYYLLGYFAASTINNLGLNVGQGALYKSIPLMYPVVLLAFFVPPASIFLFYFAGRWSFIKKHLVLVVSSLFFILAHMVHPNQQERFMLPIVPALFLLFSLAVYYQYKDHGYILKNRTLLYILAGVSLIINGIMWVPFTFGYGHGGLIKPMVWVERQNPRPSFMVIQPDMHRWIPVDYAGLDEPKRKYIRTWNDFSTLKPDEIGRGAFDLFILYPQTEAELQQYIDTVENRYGAIEYYKTFTPTMYDNIFHALNPRHYQKYEALIYRPVEK